MKYYEINKDKKTYAFGENERETLKVLAGVNVGVLSEDEINKAINALDFSLSEITKKEYDARKEAKLQEILAMQS